MTTPFAELLKERADLTSLFSTGEVSTLFHDHYTEIVDQYFRRSHQESESGRQLFKNKNPFAVIALGGYGRKDLCLFSDIDVMILFNSRVPAMAGKLVEDILYPLWNAGLELGYGIRSIKDSLSLAKEDFEVMTSMMDARFICGDSPLYLSFMDELQKKAIRKKLTAFKRWLAEKDQLRKTIFGDASNLIEPNLKEGAGGLRDYHQILWLAKAFFDLRVPRDLEYLGRLSHAEYEELNGSVQFIRLIRNHLHYLSGRKKDRLSLDHQSKIAQVLGFQQQDGILAVEHFLGKLHRAMASLKSIHRSFFITHTASPSTAARNLSEEDLPDGLHLFQGEIGFRSATAILADPYLVMDIIEQSCRVGVPLSLESKRLIREFLYLVDDPFRASPRAVRSFLRIINHRRSSEGLDQMLGTGLLAAFIPEFGKIQDMVQFDSYHLYSVGVHVLQTLEHLKSLSKGRDILLLDIFSEIKNPEVLYLAALFHDIGKMGEGHARRGALITKSILKRFQYDGRLTEDILFLVTHHLLLAQTATRRDLNDEKVIVQCARIIENPDRLRMLYLLTWADSKATGPRAWNEWVENLVQELFFKILHTLEEGELATRDSSRKVKHTVSQVRREIEGRLGSEEIDRLIEMMTPRYLLETRPADMVRHIFAFKDFQEDLRQEALRGDPSSAFYLNIRKAPLSSLWELTFLARDRPGLFADMAGVMALNSINVLTAHIYTWRDGTALDVFRVSAPLDPIHPEEIWLRVRKELKKALIGELPLSSLLTEKARPSILSMPSAPARPPDVVVDNDSSDFFTVIEVFADDEIGLLYRITDTLFHLGLDIAIAKIATKADQIADIFYVRDLEGQKIVDKEKAEEIRKTLLRRLLPSI
jgi:[protein-PII] uridylyltransferase